MDASYNNKLNIGKIILKNKLLIVFFVLAFTIGSTIIVFLIPNRYTAKVSAVPPKLSTSTMENLFSGLTSSLKDIGLSKLGAKIETTYSFLVILDSRFVKDSIIFKYRLDTVYKVPFSRMTKLRETFEGNLDVILEPEGNYVISITDEDPYRAAQMANDYVAISNFLAQKISQEESRFNREYLEKRLASIENQLSEVINGLQKFSQSTLIFSPEEQAKAISSSYIDLKATKITQEVLYELLKQKYGESDPTTLSQKTLVQGLEKKLSEVENKPGFLGNFPLKSLTKVGADFLRLYAEFETLMKVKALLIPYLEESRINENRQMRYLIVVDPALPPDQKSWPKRSLIILGSFVGSFVLILTFLLVGNSARNYFTSLAKEQ
ncbi:MAG: Wzz/FepE/Etk N-terminal domain-containing protein [Ignavibacteria bacterium]|nr:Wzz/FepE/Etk N-terminal domain-containing protein [Ignavibacteria bacterium]